MRFGFEWGCAVRRGGRGPSFFAEFGSLGGAALALVLVIAATLGACGTGSGGGYSGGGPDSGTGGSDGGALSTTDGSGPSFNPGSSSSSGSSGNPGFNPAAPPCDPASCGGAGGQCQNDVCVVRDNPGNVDSNTQSKLKAGGAADAAFAWLYPYDRTVFPRGLLPPTMQFGGAAPDAVFVRVTGKNLDYEGFYGASSPARARFGAAAWTAITRAAKASDDLTVEVTKSSGGNVTGPIKETWRIAQGSLRGTIYYETYDSQLAGGLGSVGIMRIDPGASAPTVLKQGCSNVCHTASANGSTLVADQTATTSASYDLTKNASTIRVQPGQSFAYGALTPDGALLMSATNYRTWAFDPSALYDTRTGAKVSAPGWDGVIKNGGTPSFSPDGKHIAFNHEDTGGGRSLAMMDVNLATHTFSNLADIASDPQRTLAWPAFTPDSAFVVYHAGTNVQFETDRGARGDLYAVDTATHKTARLDLLDGYSGGNSYLPAGDPDLSFAPTVLPEAVGGYFWVVFTSHRSYGNTLASQDHSDEYGKLWVAALDIEGTPGKDISHPAFFLEGQEISADNLRGFWVLPPCKGEGNTCETGDECCEGYCRASEGGAASVCVPPPGGCSNEFETCTTAADCCNAAMQCINGRCAAPAVR